MDSTYQFNSLKEIDSLKLKSQNLYANNLQHIEFDPYLKEAIAVAKTTENNLALFELYELVGKRYRNSSKYAEAIELQQEALDLANAMKDNLLKAKATHEMAVNFRRINDNAQALKLHTQALELAENVRDTFLIHCSFNGIGNVYVEYKDYELAIEYFHKSLEFLGKEMPNYLGEAINSNLLGETWLILGNTDSALYYLNRSFSANVKIGSELGKAICHNGMGLVYNKKGDYNTALKEYKIAIAVFENLGEKYYKAMCLNNMGNTYIALHQYKLAELHLINTIAIAEEIGSKGFALEASLKLGDLYNSIGDAKHSYQYNRMAMAYKDSVTANLQKQNTEAMKTVYRSEKQAREILILKQNSELAKLKMNRQQYIFVGLGLFAAIFILLVYLVFRQKALKSKINEIGLEQKLLRAQLNPHFVFNSLSAIQNFILLNDKKAASEYLVNFSRLMRNILIGSGTDFILLEQELEMLDDYLKLQQLRFQQKFEYFFELLDDLSPQECLLPPMLIQPFVENAIEHGVRNIDHQGIIMIRFQKKNSNLLIEVEDNGRGINDETDKDRKKDHVSMATNITQQRMKNIQALTGSPCKLEVIDNKIHSGLTGVLVRIEVPYQSDE